MPIDLSSWLAIAAFFGVVVTAIVSTTNMIISKDQKTTEFRQEWINHLRIEISALISSVKSRKTIAHIFSHTEGEGSIDEKVGVEIEKILKILDDDSLKNKKSLIKPIVKDAIKDNANNEVLLKTLKTDSIDVTRDIECHHAKINLYLNPDEHVVLLEQIKELVSMSSFSKKHDMDEITEKSNMVIDESAKVLKKEWDIVKKGEPSFYMTKNIFISIMIVISIITMIIMATINVPVPTNLVVP